MMSALPEIAVSAADQSAADAFVAELIGSDGEGEANEGHPADTTRVWHLLTKYYRARVRVRVLLDDAPVDGQSGITEAHVVYLTESECVSGVALERRLAHGAGAEVRVAACDVTAGGMGDALWSAARAHGYEVVPLRAPATDGDDDDDEPWGVAAVRDALYAHLWPNLRRLDDVFMLNGSDADDLQWSDSDGEPPGADNAGDVGEVGDVERAGRLMSALAAVRAHNQPAAAADAAGAWSAARPERLRRAEDLLAAFTRALR